ncbi:enoyl-ACP reductase FabI [Immundisolibacter cernigliae]|uniref:Enoyl-[acyl-carrier-protein] reductase [NADH] n=1 Tax=Immundisolibacter cernigliae TaxID=1810504 RepID=A0A1B1YTS4_9GAMM|nr:enoyl-ACP reductase [Immundisolibacter cernigliae]ANX04166.1 enoyl-ACP reductase [Immundisolibacter cernigliae]
MGFLTGKRALVVGVASDRSIATGIAEAMHRQGAELAFTYQNDKLRKRVEEFAAECGSDITLPLDVGDDAQIDAAFAALGQRWDGFDIVVHSVAFAPREELQGSFVEAVTREGFRQAHDISAYSLAALAKAARPMLRPGGALLALTYLGAVRVLPNYNVMGLAKASLEACIRYLAASMGPDGIRVNGISAGPIRTLAASGISGLRSMLDYHAAHAPLRRNVSIEDVGNVAAFLCSDLAAGVTGEITYVDGGYNIVGMGG